MIDVADIAALADELCDPHQHVERVPYWDDNRNRKWREHRTTQPGLFYQLADLVGDLRARSGSDDEGSGRPVPDSRPPANLDALSAHTEISIAAARWCWSLNLELRAHTEGNIRALVGVAGRIDSDTRDALAAEMRHWRSMASVLTGWKSPPYQPYVPCPELDCQRVGKLRVNLERRNAMCLACGSTWGTDLIADLADYVKAVSEGAAA